MADFIRQTKGNRDVRVDGNGEVEFHYPSYDAFHSYHDECLEFSIKELEIILAEAKAHKAAYDAFKAAEYDEDAYTKAYKEPTRK